MFLAYIALQSSIKVLSISRIPIMSDTTISIVMNNEDRLAQSHNSNFATRFVSIKGTGSIFESDPNSNSIGRYLGSSGEPTITTGNHLAWEVLARNVPIYYVDSVAGEIIVKSNLSKLRILADDMLTLGKKDSF